MSPYLSRAQTRSSKRLAADAMMGQTCLSSWDRDAGINNITKSLSLYPRDLLAYNITVYLKSTNWILSCQIPYHPYSWQVRIKKHKQMAQYFIPKHPKGLIWASSCTKKWFELHSSTLGHCVKSEPVSNWFILPMHFSNWLNTLMLVNFWVRIHSLGAFGCKCIWSSMSHVSILWFSHPHLIVY